ncbi:MAG: RsmE family RNA methyltransferase [Christensenellales bacterium]|jgi:16S rRNA (uracil1498-N3)-methyltransferase
MHRFFVDKSDKDEKSYENGEMALLGRDEAAHIKVLRLKEGDGIELIDGRGGRFLGEILRIDGSQREIKEAHVRIKERLPSNEPEVLVTIYQGLPKAAKAELVVQKCTELGLFAYVPVQMLRCDVKLSDGAKKLDRLSKIALEAAKQSGRSMIPTMHEAMPIERAAQMMRNHDLLLAPWEKGGISFDEAVKSRPGAASIGIVIGPEGGIEEVEIALLKEAGAVIVTMGSRILRTETAAIGALAALMCLKGQWSI